MPRDSNGNYTLPVGNPVIANTVIEAAWANTTLEDVALSLQNSLSRYGNGGMLVPLKGVDGSAANPSFTFNNEPTSGLYRAGINDVRMAVNGVDVLRWVPSGIEAWVPVPGVWQSIAPITSLDGATVTDNGVSRYIENAISARPVQYYSLLAAAAADNSGYDAVLTNSFVVGLGKGGALYDRESPPVVGAPSTLYADYSGFYDANGDGFALNRAQRINFYMFGVRGDRVNDDTLGLQNAVDWADSGAELWLLVGDYLCSGITITKPLSIRGEGWNDISLDSAPDVYLGGSNLRMINGGEDYLITIEKDALVNRQNQLYGVFLSDFSLDGANRTLDKGALKISNLDGSCIERLKIFSFQREWLNCYEEVRETDFKSINVRWCGSAPNYPALNMTENGLVDAHNLLRFTDINVGFSLGDDVLIDGALSTQNMVRQCFFTNCVWHGVLKTQSGGRYGVFTTAQQQTNRIVVKGGQNIYFNSCTSIQRGDGASHLLMQQESGLSINPVVFWSGPQEGRYDDTVAGEDISTRVEAGTLHISEVSFLNCTDGVVEIASGAKVIRGSGCIKSLGAGPWLVGNGTLVSSDTVNLGPADFKVNTPFPGATEADFGGNKYKCWSLADAATQGITASIPAPSTDLTRCRAYISWVNLGGASGDVVFNFFFQSTAPGETTDNAGAGVIMPPATAGADDVLVYTPIDNTLTIAQGDIISVRVVRTGTVGTDTLTNAVGIVGVTLIPV